MLRLEIVPIQALKHTHQVRGMASTLRMRTTMFRGSQPTATTCLQWSWRLKECFCTHLCNNLQDDDRK